jgi:hypothetical protein
MPIKKRINFLLIFLIISLPASPQAKIKGTIIEKSTRLPVSFATITYKKQSVLQGVISDVNGKFTIPDAGIKNLSVSCIGYVREDYRVTPSTDLLNILIELRSDTLNLGEIVVTPANNPAIRIIKNALNNKTRNNFENYEKFSYQCYFKTLMNLKISYNSPRADSAAGGKEINSDRARFISESVVSCSRFNNRTNNKILAVRTSGFENPMLAQYFFMVFHNSISFYNNNIALFEMPVSEDKTNFEYLSPLSDDCLKSYEFYLEETYENLADSIFIIEFHPKKNKRFNSLKGKLYISSNGFAIRNIVTEPYEKGLIDFKFRQDYEFIDNRWFPTLLNEEIGFSSMKINKKIQAYPAYLITSKISNVNLNPSISPDSLRYDNVYLDQSSLGKSDSILRAVRPDSLTTAEKNAYIYMDRLGKKIKFDYVAEIYPNIMAGKIPLSFFDLDLQKLYTGNAWEKTRIGIGLSTNDKLSKVFSVGGFAGYGTKDEKLKYGGNVVLNINREKEIKFKLSYQNNLKEPGLELNEDFALMSLNDYLRNYIAYRFDNFIEGRAELDFRLLHSFKFSAGVAVREIKPTYEYLFRGSPLTDYQADEIQISARYAHGEEFVTFGSRRFVSYRGNPVIRIVYKRGIDFFHKQSYIYNRIETAIDIRAYKGRLGQSDIRLAGGLVDKSLPYGLLFTGEGSKSTIPLVINNTFQTMKPYEFLSDRYVNLFYSHNFGSLLFERPRFKPKFIITQNTGWGTLRNSSYQGIDFREKDKVYLEAGLLINNLVAFKVFNLYHIGFGGGAFYRYGYYTNEKIIDNFAFKVAVQVSYK